MYLSNIFTYKSTSLCIINYSFLWNSRGLRDYHPRTMALRASLMPSLRTHSTARMPGYAGPNFTHFSSRRVAHPVGTLRGDQRKVAISGKKLLEVPTIYQASVRPMSGDMPPNYMAFYGTAPPF